MKRYFACIFSGLLIGLSFPTVLFGWHLPNLGFLAWFSLIPLFLLLRKVSPNQAFRYSFLTATIYFYISFAWLYNALHDFGYLHPILSFLPVLGLALLMALTLALGIWLAQHLLRDTGGAHFIWYPICFTLFEWIRSHFPFGGFAWSNLALSQSGYLPIIQIADLTGIYGIIFLIVWVNAYLTELILKCRQQPVPFFIPKTVVTVALILFTLGYGFFQIPRQDFHLRQVASLNVGLIQPNIPQDEKVDPTSLARNQIRLQEAVHSLQKIADFIVWPETSWTELLWANTTFVAPEKMGVTLPRENRPYNLFGVNFQENNPPEEIYFNGAALADASGRILGSYHKVHLVPFGEYIPLKKLFFFLDPVVAIGNYHPGSEAKPLSFDRWKVGPLICFEDIFPDISRAHVKQGAHFLANLTNDAWYGNSSAAYQHLALAKFRSVETRRAMVRSTNTGVTAVIYPTGKVVNVSPTFAQSTIVHRIPLLEGQTVYTKLGDWFVGGCFLMVGYGVAQCLKNSKKK